MIKYAKIINQESGLCEVGLGDNIEFYQSIGMTEIDIKKSDIDGSWYLADKCPMLTDEEKEKKERERLDNLSLTAADVERAIYKAKGMDFEDILNLVKNNPDIDSKALKIELKANNFYRGNPYINQIGALLNLTPQMLDEFFETNDYRALIADEEPDSAGEASQESSNTLADLDN